jgi:hypothetical protein
MVEKAGSPYRSANAGELSPEAAGRVDVKQFYSAGLRYKNMEPVPLSGFRDMAGSFDNGLVRGQVSVLAQSGVSVTAGPHTGTQTIWQATVTGKVVAIDCAALDADTGEHVVQAQALVGATWVNVGSPVTVGTAARAITMAAAPGAGLAATAVRLRAVLSVAASITTGAVVVLSEAVAQDVPRYTSVRHDSGARYFCSLQTMFMDVFEDDDFVAGVYLPTVTDDVLPHVDFYAEDATIGIAQNTLQTLRIRRGGSSAEWVRDLWPYEGIPKVDLGGVYPKTDDQWEVQLSWTGTPFATLTLTVDGETTPGIPFVDSFNAPIAISGAVDNAVTAANIKAELENLPSLTGGTVTVVIVNTAGSGKRVDIEFGGTLSGAEYQLNSSITNTAEVAALASHVTIGKTDFEPLFSVARGYPGVFGFVQDRLAMGDILAVPPAISISQGGEYFTLNIESAGASAARLDKLRAGQVSERVLAFAEATYFLVGTDRGIHFASNRTISKTDPLNFVQVSQVGLVPNCKFVKLEGKVFSIGANPTGDSSEGHQVLSLAYSEIETSFDATPEHIMASHLVDRITRAVGQVATGRGAASKMWMMRSDGRLIAACVIKSQDILGFCEWISADGGAVVELHVDTSNDVRLAVRRGGVLRHERQDRSTLFHATVRMTPDLAGTIRGLSHLEGRQVWAEIEGYMLGPFTVNAGEIELGDVYQGPALVGLWQPPLWESMPRYLITRSDEIVRRPGRIHSARLQLIDTTSVAVGANGGEVEDVPLTTTNDLVTQGLTEKTTSVRRVGMLGFKIGPTMVVTQKRPGKIHVRDLEFQEKL